MNDKVICNNCGFKGVIQKGSELCPQCKKSGYLEWQDENKQETEKPITKIKKGQKVPWLWLNENEDSATADNGIVLVRDYNNGGPAVFIPPLQEAAADMLDALQIAAGIINDEWGTTKDGDGVPAKIKAAILKAGAELEYKEEGLDL